MIKYIACLLVSILLFGTLSYSQTQPVSPTISISLKKNTGPNPIDWLPIKFQWVIDTVGNPNFASAYRNSRNVPADLYYEAQLARDLGFSSIIAKDTMVSDNYNYYLWPSHYKHYTGTAPARPSPDTTVFSFQDTLWVYNALNQDIPLYFRVNARWVWWWTSVVGPDTTWTYRTGARSDWSTSLSFVILSTYFKEKPPIVTTKLVSLDPSYPNPSIRGDIVTIRYNIKSAGAVHLSLYDLLGREMSVLVDENRPAGYGFAFLNTAKLPSGTYIYRISSGGAVDTKTMVIVN